MSFSTRAAASAALVSIVALFSFSASAHVTLETREAASDSYFKAVFTVPHGCEGTPTRSIRVRIPEGVTGVKPQPRPGWKLATTKAKYEKPIDDGHGGKITEGVREVSWSGGSLPDDQFEEFKVQMKLPDAANTTLYFPVVQECAKGVTRWIEVPDAGSSGGKAAGELRHPAPALRLRGK